VAPLSGFDDARGAHPMNNVASRKRGETSRKSLKREQASPPGIQARTPATNPSRVQILWAASFAALLIGLYLKAGFGLWFVAGVLAALLFLGARQERMRAVDGALLLIAGFEIPSLLSSGGTRLRRPLEKYYSLNKMLATLSNRLRVCATPTRSGTHLRGPSACKCARRNSRAGLA